MESFKLQDLFDLIEGRKTDPPAGSYTAELLAAGEEKIGKKLVEETVEVLLAARTEGTQRLVEESSDLLYHLFVMLAARGVTLSDVEVELRRRHQP